MVEAAAAVGPLPAGSPAPTKLPVPEQPFESTCELGAITGASTCTRLLRPTRPGANAPSTSYRVIAMGIPVPDVRALLIWAEGQADEVDDTALRAGAVEVHLNDDVFAVSAVLYPAIRSIISDSVMQRSERCQNGSGLELWRRLYSEMRGAAPQVAMVQAEMYQFPQRAPQHRRALGPPRALAFAGRGSPGQWVRLPRVDAGRRITQAGTQRP